MALEKKWQDAIEALDALEGDDGEGLHSMADRIILDRVPIAVFEAYDRVVERVEFWACA